MRATVGDGSYQARRAKLNRRLPLRWPEASRRGIAGAYLELPRKVALSSALRTVLALLMTLSVLLIGFLDYLSTYEITWSIVYVFPIAVATWYIGVPFAAFLGAASVAVWIGGDVVAGAPFSSWWVPVWNAAIRFAFFGAFIFILSRVRDLTGDLEARVTARTAEMKRLEKELLEVGERERRRIGSDIHDGLGQHLTGTSLAAQYLRRHLRRRGAPEVEQANELINLIEEGIALSHKLAKGLQPVDMHATGLMQALQDLAPSASSLLKVSCQFRCDAPVLVRDVGSAEHLYRIAQEATSNAAKHGRASNVVISLETEEDGVVLRVSDDGAGFNYSASTQQGMGLRIMAKRASIIGARFEVESQPGYGTIVSCKLPRPSLEDSAGV